MIKWNISYTKKIQVHQRPTEHIATLALEQSKFRQPVANILPMKRIVQSEWQHSEKTLPTAWTWDSPETQEF